MRALIIFGILGGLPGLLPAQETAQSFLPNYSAGGLYGLWSSEADFDDGSGGGFQLYEAGINVPVPLVRTDDFIATAGFRFRYNQLQVDGFEPISGDLDLYRLQVPFNFWLKSSERWKFWLRAEPGIHSDFEDLSGDDFVFTALALASYQLREGFRVAFGGYYSKDLGEERLLPAAGFIWEPNPHWILSITVPRLYASYAPVEGTLFTAYAYPGGAGWNVTDPDTGEDFDLEYQNIRAAISAQKQLFGPVWGYIEGGYQFLQSLGTEFTEEVDAEGSWFGSGGVQLRF